MIDANAIDDGNEDYLVDKFLLLGFVKDGIALDIWMTRLWNIWIFIEDTGKVIFLEMYERKLKETLVLEGKCYMYRNPMQLGVQNFKNEILNGEKYRPYKYY